MTLTPNLHFTGQCRQAIALYARAFGAQTRSLLTYGQAGDPDTLRADHVYHAEVAIGPLRLVMNDYADTLPTPAGSTVSLMASFDTVGEAEAAHAALADGAAQIITPPCATGYSDYFASLVDRFGVRWELIVEK